MDMEENNKVIIFEKKEIILLLVFVLVLIVTSFTLGIRLGKKLTMNEVGIKKEDIETVEMKSAAEEDADEIVVEDSKLTDEQKLKKLMEESKSRLADELEKFSKEEIAFAPTETAEPKNSMAGKFTIQLGSYDAAQDAKQFAEGFTVRGYSPIINEVRIPGKGNWYRVSLGLFDTVDEAKVYIRGEQSLFAGQDHIITEIR
jgi:cell division protein FtsN